MDPNLFVVYAAYLCLLLAMYRLEEVSLICIPLFAYMFLNSAFCLSINVYPLRVWKWMARKIHLFLLLTNMRLFTFVAGKFKALFLHVDDTIPPKSEIETYVSKGDATSMYIVQDGQNIAKIE